MRVGVMMISTNSARWGDEDGGEQCEVGWR